ncbi:class I SAM-dependent methyltransferase [Nocardiopsis gilva]|nr:class I SAM-dependent methyltransferase [Nocardiopsis gilva]
MPLPRARLLTLLVVGAVGGIGLLATLRTADALGWAAALGLAALGTVGLVLGILALLVRRVTHQILRLSRTLDQNTRSMSEAFGEHRVEFAEIIEGTRAELAGSFDRVRTAVREIHGNLDHIRSGAADTPQAHQFGHFPSTSDSIPRQDNSGSGGTMQEDVQKSGAAARFSPKVPTPRGWATSPDVQRFVALAVLERQPGLVVECGSGTSSIWLGETLRRTGTGRLVTLEHDERYARLARDMVAAHGLDDIVEVRFAPLTEWQRDDGDDRDAPGDADAPAWRWYDREAVRDLSGIDMLFVDGPPTDAGARAHYPAGPVLFPLCSPSALIVLDDDTDPADDEAAGDHWMAEDPVLQRESLPGEADSVHVFTWKQETA